MGINRYRIIEEIGRGAMGSVHRAYDRLQHQMVALKRVTSVTGTPSHGLGAGFENETERVALANEFRTLARLRHPNVIEVLDYGFDDQFQPYFTMTLLDHTRAALLDVAQNTDMKHKAQLVIQILLALDYLHRHNILHRDVKPSNIMVQNRDQVKVLDFGLATPIDEASGIKGTLLYMAPELLEGGSASHLADLYSVGMVAYQIFTGELPYPYENTSALIQAILLEEPSFDAIDTPALVAVMQRWLAKDPDSRFQTANEVIVSLCDALDMPIPSESSAIRESYLQAAQFIGRTKELEMLTQALSQAKWGQGRLYLVGGESGVGKSRLLDELRTVALVEGIQVLRGYSLEQGGLPHQLWRSALPPLFLSGDVSNEIATILKPLIPELDEILGYEVPLPQALEGEQEQIRLALSIAKLFQQQTQPILLLLEDLQWAETDLLPLQYILKQMTQLQLLVVATYRNDECPNLPDEFPNAKTITLQRFDNAEVQQLTNAMLGSRAKDDALVHTLHKHSEGNIFFLIEVLHMMAETSGNLAAISPDHLTEDVLPGGIDRLLQRRLQKIPTELQSISEFAAVLGRDFDIVLLQNQFSSEKLEQWLLTANAAAVLEVYDEVWRFTHDKVRYAVLNQIPNNQLAALHRRAATAMEAVYPDNPDYYMALLEHWHLAGDLDKEIHYLAPVVEQLSKFQVDYERAKHIIERVVDMLPSTDMRRASLLLLLAKVNYTQGDYKIALGMAEQAHTLALQHDDKRLIVDILYRLSAIILSTGTAEEGQAYLEQALSISQAIGYDKSLANIYMSLGHLATDHRNYEAALDYLEQSRIKFEANNDQYGVAACFNSIGLVKMHMGKPDIAKDYYEHSLTIRETLGDIRGRAEILNNLATRSRELGAYEESIEYQKRSLSLYDQINNIKGVAIATINLGGTYHYLANFEKALAYYIQARDAFESIGNHYGVGLCFVNMGNILIEMKQFDQAEIYIRQSLEIMERLERVRDISQSHMLLGTLYYNQANYDRALEEFREALVILDTGVTDIAQSGVHINLGFTYLQRKSSQASEQLARGLDIASATKYHIVMLESLMGFAWVKLNGRCA